MGTYMVWVGEYYKAISLPDYAGQTLVVPNVAALVFRSDDETELVLQRRDDGGPADGLFELPGGGWRAGESATEAVAREVREETGLTVHLVDDDARRSEAQEKRPFITTRPLLACVGVEAAYPVLHVAFRCYADGEPRPKPGESRDPAWFAVDAVRTWLDKPEEFTGHGFAILSAYFAGSGNAVPPVNSL